MPTLKFDAEETMRLIRDYFNVPKGKVVSDNERQRRLKWELKTIKQTHVEFQKPDEEKNDH